VSKSNPRHGYQPAGVDRAFLGEATQPAMAMTLSPAETLHIGTGLDNHAAISVPGEKGSGGFTW